MRGGRWIMAGVLATAAIGAGLGWLAAPPARPNIVLVVFDTTRADHLGTYGWPRPTSPHVDALARRGVRFDAHHSTSSWTKPGMASLLTGRYAREVGVYEERFDRLPNNAVTLAERLRDLGYTTLGVSSNPNTNAVFGYDQGFDVYSSSDVVWNFMAAPSSGRVFDRHQRPLPDAAEVTATALQLVDEHRQRGPVFLQVLYIDPHTPYDAPKEALAAVGPGASPYEAEIRHADHGFGALMDGLAARGFGEDTLVILTSDHGEGLDSHPGVPLAHMHGYTLYDSVTRVPLVLAGAGLPSGVAVDALSSHVDVLPTVLELVGGPEVPGPGTSLLGRIAGEPGPEAVFAETDWRVCEKTSVRTRSHRFSLNPDHARYRQGVYESGASEFDKRFLAALPDEEAYAMNGKWEHPSRSGDAEAEGLRELLERWNAETPRHRPVDRARNDRIHLADGTEVADPFAGDKEDVDEATAEALRALGYLQ